MLEIFAFGVTLEFLDNAKARNYDIGGKRNTRETVEESYKKAGPMFEAIKNVNWTRIAFDPDDPKCYQEYFEILKSKKFDAISLGGGLRTIPELSELFTKMVNDARREQPSAVLVFPLLPHEVIPALKAQIPEMS